MSHATSVIHPGVELGPGVQLDDFVVVGRAAGSDAPGAVPTRIGAGAVLRSHSVIYAGAEIGAGFQTGHGALVRERARIGDDVSVGSHAVVERDVTMGHGVRVHSQAFVGEETLLEDGCWIGPRAVLTNVLHPLCPEAKRCLRGARVRAGAKIGANVTILPDLEIGEMALVGAGAVVVASVPPRAVVVGSPARVVRTIDELTCPYDLIEHPYPELS